VTVAGLRFATPIGLAAGFDKSARAVPFLSALGFSHVEVGSVSAGASVGNPAPRLFRLPAERAVVVHYGVPNDGAEAVATRLAAPRPAVPLGINVVSTNRLGTETDAAVIADYVASVGRLQRLADYVVLNLSCPNTRDGRGFFADLDRLRRLLAELGDVGVERPLFIKVAPFADGPDAFLEAVAGAPFVSGFSVNLPPGKPPGLEHVEAPGAVSGRPAAAAALRTVAELYGAMDRDRYAVIGSGGVFDAGDALRMIRHGASLVQLYTALVYEGPGVVRAITAGLADRLGPDGVAGALGADVS
jgi:dihydroorotate dehydrogenase (fumarate)/dihydroorotate dehydrogenase